MPSLIRNSSMGPIGNPRRGPQKPHIPYRADDLETGKKTGIAVNYIDRKSDGFESFSEMMKQADGRTPAKGKRKSVIQTTRVEEEEEDGGGEMSMDLDEQTSFSVLNQDDEDGDENDMEDGVQAAINTTPIATSSPRHGSGKGSSGKGSGKGKGKARAVSPPVVPASDDLPEYDYEVEDNGMGGGMEDDIGQELQDVEMDAGFDDEEGGEDKDEEVVHAKKGKMTKAMAKDKKLVEKKRRKVVEVPKEYSPPPGVRRGTRHRYKPLDFWRLEKVVYGRRENGISYVPQIKEIVRIPQEPVEPLGTKRKRAKSVKRQKSESKALEEVVLNPEEGWDDDTEPTGVVIDYVTKEEVSRRIAFTAKMVRPKAAANNDWFFQKVFGDGEFIAAGQLIIPPKGRKPSKGTKDNTYVFYVIEGAVNLKVNNTTLVLASGAMFLVPRGNTYFIENIAERDAKLFFTQARKVLLTEDEEQGGDTVQRTPRRSSEGTQRISATGRSSSAGVTSAHSGVNGLQRRAMSTKV